MIVVHQQESAREMHQLTLELLMTQRQQKQLADAADVFTFP